MDNTESKNENAQERQNAPVDGEYSFFYGHKPENEQSPAQGEASRLEPEMPKAEKKPFWKKPGAMIAGVLVAAMIAGFGGSAIGNAVFGGSGGGTTVYQGKRPSSVINTASIDTSKQMTPAEVYAENVNSTVGITTQVTTNFWGYTTQSAASGSGFIYSADGYIITNYHVIESASSIKVTLYDGKSYDAQLVGYDESNDIAVLKIDATDLTPVVLGDSDTLNVGDSVVAIGNPLGELTFSLTTGVVSALDRPVTLSTGTTMNLIQTDCAINSGNSGGALFNLYGEVIGITNAKYSSSGSSSEASIDNIGFAIPIDQVRSIFESIITNGYIVKPYIGVTVSDVSSESQSYGLPQGAAVRSVTENGPAAEAGLQENDIITAVNGETITGSNDLVKLVKASAAGDTLELTVYRQGQTTTLTLTVGEQKTDALPAQTTDQNQQSQQGYYDGGQSGQSDNQFGGSWPFGFGFGG